VTRLLALALVFLAWSSAGFAAPQFPTLTGRVVDEAGILPPATETRLTEKLAALEASTGRQVVVVTLPTLQGYEIEEYGYQLGRAWGIGEAKENNGALLIVAPNERRVRIEVGYGLEGVLTDALSNVILQERVLPRFKTGDMAGGIESGADAIIEQLQLPADEARQRATTAQSQDFDIDPELIVFLIIFALWFVFVVTRARRFGRRAGGVVPPVIIWDGGRRGGGWGGGGWSGGGGGGWSGGGGTFGGGGSSGSW
jgi:uncharacterized protein